MKLLPGGEPVQLTHDSKPKLAPSFSPDNSRIAYSRGGAMGHLGSTCTRRRASYASAQLFLGDVD